MAKTLKARAGSSLIAEIRYEDEEGNPIDTTGSTVYIQVRAWQPHQRVILESQEYTGTLPSPDGTVLTQVDTGSWELFLGKSTTEHLPPTTRWELEMVSDSDPENVTLLESGVILTEPQIVTEIT